MDNGCYIFGIVDNYTRYYECVFMQSTVSSKIVEALAGVFEMHGFPLSLKSDNGLQYISRKLRGTRRVRVLNTI